MEVDIGAMLLQCGAIVFLICEHREMKRIAEDRRQQIEKLEQRIYQLQNPSPTRFVNQDGSVEEFDKTT